ncbi:MAG: glycosyltransferase [Microscillaceae bacterium]|jgi:glycosyltransferase involved in cell wall biosynthesis|nr:glycosyltransferase [Microscillaceae bacterium]
MPPTISILVIYRNRAIDLVERCLKSLAKQTFEDWELIFLDYGSDSTYSDEVKNMVQKYDSMHYHYAATQGWYWNRAQAINQGLLLVKGQFVLILDIDILLPPLFLQSLMANYTPNTAWYLKCYNLPAYFDEYESLEQKASDWAKKSSVTNSLAQGNIFLQLSDLQAVGGYDEFYRWWGREDNDLSLLLQNRGLALKVCEFAQQFVFHQWHLPSNDQMPKGWQKIYEQHYQNKKKRLESQSTWVNQPTHYQLISLEQRPALRLFLAQDLSPNRAFVFEFPKEAAWVKFQNRFHQLNSQDYLWVKQDFALLPSTALSRLGKWLHWVNHRLDKTPFSYRFIDLNTYFTEAIGLLEVRDFIFYFILFNPTHIQDYYFSIQNQTLHLILVKK